MLRSPCVRTRSLRHVGLAAASIAWALATAASAATSSAPGGRVPPNNFTVIGTATLSFAAAATLKPDLGSAIQVLTQGVPNLDFAYAAGGTCSQGASYAARATCTVNYSFAPSSGGLRKGAVRLVSNTGGIVATAFISGNGVSRPFVPGTITTIAGNGPYGFIDNVAGSAGGLYMPHGLAFDATGNLYIGDCNNSRIRMVSGTTGVITTVAGSGQVGDNDGNGTAATLNCPGSLSFDGVGDLFFSEFTGNEIRKVAAGADHAVMRVAGQFRVPAPVTSGGVTAVSSNTTLAVPGFSGDNGPASASQLAFPDGVAVDGAGTLYFADQYNNRIRRVDAATGLITTVAGSGIQGYSGDGGPATAAQLGLPFHPVLDAAGNVYVTHDCSIRKVEVATGLISTVFSTAGDDAMAPDGSSVKGAFCGHLETIDSAGYLYVTDHQRIRRIEPGTGIVTTLAGGGPGGLFDGAFSGDGGLATAARLNAPANVVFDANGDLVFIDYGNNRVRKIKNAVPASPPPVGIGVFQAGVAVSLASSLSEPRGVSQDGAGNIYVSESGTGMLFRLDGTTGARTVLRSGINGPTGTAVDATGNVFYGSDGDGKVYELHGGTGTPDPIATIPHPDNAMVLDSAGNLYVSSGWGPSQIYQIAAGTHGVTAVTAPGQIGRAIGLAIDAQDNLYAADYVGNTIVEIPARTSTVIKLVTNSGLSNPHGLAIDRAGNLYVADNSGPAGVLRYAAGTRAPSTITGAIASKGLAVDARGNLLLLTQDSVTRYDRTQTPIVAITAGAATPLAFENVGDGPLAIASISTTDGRYTATSACGPALQSGASCTTGIGGTAGASGATLAISDNALGIPGTLLGAVLQSVATPTPPVGVGVFPTGVSMPLASSLSEPRGVSQDGAGNIYVSESGTGMLFRLDGTTGARTVLRSGINGPTGTAVDAAGDVFYGSDGDGKVYELHNGSGAPDPIATIPHPDNAMVLDGAGNLYVSSGWGPSTIYRIEAGTHAVSAVMAPGQIGRAIGLAIDAQDNLYAADYSGNTVVEIPAHTSTIVRLASGLSNPHGVAIDRAGNLYVANNRGPSDVVRYAAGTRAPSTIAGATATVGIAVDARGSLILLTHNAVTRYDRSQSPALGISRGGSDLLFENVSDGLLTFTATASQGYSVARNYGGCAVQSDRTISMARGQTCHLTVTQAADAPGMLSIVSDRLGVAGTLQTVALASDGSGIGAFSPGVKTEVTDSSASAVAWTGYAYPGNAYREGFGFIARSDGTILSLRFGHLVQTIATGLPALRALGACNDRLYYTSSTTADYLTTFATTLYWRTTLNPSAGDPSTAVASVSGAKGSIVCDGGGNAYFAGNTTYAGGNGRLYRYDRAGGTMSYVAVPGIVDVAIDGLDNVYVATGIGGRNVLKITAGRMTSATQPGDTSILVTVVNDTRVLAAHIAIDPSGSLYVLDSNTARILRYDGQTYASSLTAYQSSGAFAFNTDGNLLNTESVRVESTSSGINYIYGVFFYDRSQAPTLTVPAGGAPVVIPYTNVGTGLSFSYTITSSDPHYSIDPSTTCGPRLWPGATCQIAVTATAGAPSATLDLIIDGTNDWVNGGHTVTLKQ